MTKFLLVVIIISALCGKLLQGSLWKDKPGAVLVWLLFTGISFAAFCIIAFNVLALFGSMLWKG